MVTPKDDDFYFSDYLNNRSSENEDQSVALDDNLDNSHNSIYKSDRNNSVRDDNNSDTREGKGLILNDDDNNA